MRTLLPAILALLLALPPCAKAAATHPLDPLDSDEIGAALAILKKENRLKDSSRLPYLMLKEPPKQEVLAFAPGKAFRREALAVVYDKDSGSTSEITVDLRAGKVAEAKVVAGAHPSVMLSEFEAVPRIVKADPRFAAAMKRRGIDNLDDVAVDAWAYGSPDSEHTASARLLRAVAYYKGTSKNFYARPIDGVSAVVNMDEGKVEKLLDTTVYPVPQKASDFDLKSLGPQREAPKPLNIVQPEGPSFTLDGSEVRWQNWSFRFAMLPREGLVLYLVRWNDHGVWRPILYRGSLAEMMVPYGHPDPQWTWRAAFDEGEYGIGRYSGSLEKGTDVPANAKLFDAVFVDDFGKPYATPDAVALYERDGGLLWKHFDMYNGGNVSRRSRELVIGFITTISNYDYGINWVFKQDGSIEVEAQLTGIMQTKGSELTSVDGHDHAGSPDAGFGHLVAPNVVAPHHQHFFSFRLDLDVDGGPNSVAELNTEALAPGDPNPGRNAFTMAMTPLKSELAAQRDVDLRAQRKWLVYNPEHKGALGYPSGYILIPGETGWPYLQDDSPLLRRGGFVKHQFWATQEHDDELYAAGVYPTQRAEADGLPVWTKRDASLEKTDLVVWYNVVVTHSPRPEEWPLMGVHKSSFQLVPAAFFERNPGLDLP